MKLVFNHGLKAHPLQSSTSFPLLVFILNHKTTGGTRTPSAGRYLVKHHGSVAHHAALGRSRVCQRGIKEGIFHFQLKDAFVQRERRKEALSMRGRKHSVTTQEAQLLGLVVCN